jgi:hypothetical protein
LNIHGELKKKSIVPDPGKAIKKTHVTTTSEIKSNPNLRAELNWNDLYLLSKFPCQVGSCITTSLG